MNSSGHNDKQEPRQSQAFDREMVEAFASLFKGRTDCWGKISTPTGKCVYETITLQHYRSHLKGETSLGVYFNLDDSTCHFAAIDIDDFSFNKAKAVRAALKSIGIPAYIAASKSNHHHVFLFAEDRFNSREIRRILIHIRDELGIKTDKGRTLEVFPKQDEHHPDDPPSKKYPKGKKYPGSYINLPCFGATRPFLAADNNGGPKEVPLKVALERIKRVPQETVERVLQTLPKGQPLEPKKVVGRRKEHPPCLEIISQGVDEQQRDSAALALARHYLIQAYEPEEVFWLLQKWDTKNKPPSHDETFLENTVRIAEKYHGFFCSLIKDKPTVSIFCVGDEKCDWPKLREAIEFYERERLCYLPAYWGHKDPYVKWEEFEARLPTRAEKAEWFHQGKPTNIGTLCGGISGGHKLQQGRLG